MLKGPLLSSSAGIPSIPAALRPFSFCKLWQTSQVVTGAFKASADASIHMERSHRDSLLSAAQGSLVAQGGHPACSASAHADCAAPWGKLSACASQTRGISVPCLFMQAYQCQPSSRYSYCRCFLRRTALYMLRSFKAAKGTITGERSASFHSLQAYRHSSSNQGGRCISFDRLPASELEGVCGCC